MVCECGHGYWHLGLSSLNVELHFEKFGMLKWCIGKEWGFLSCLYRCDLNASMHNLIISCDVIVKVQWKYMCMGN